MEEKQKVQLAKVVVVDFDMPFVSMANFMVKLAFASLIAAFIFSVATGAVVLVALLVLSLLGVS